jgi:small subunit ribosomal protein S3
LVIGKKGKDIEDLRKDLKNLVKRDVNLSIIEARKADMDAQLVAEGIAFQLERRVNFRRAMKDAVGRAQRVGAEGIKIRVSGRLNGAEIARTEATKEGRVPLHTLRADIDYGFAEASTTYGIIGVKVWVFKGEKFAPGEEQIAEAIQM